MKPLIKPQRYFNPVFLTFLLVTFLVGIAGALQTPTLSRFLTNEVHETPFWVGVFYSINASVSIVVSFVLALRSDRMGDRRKLIIFCCLMAIGNSLLFAFNRHYLILASAGVLFAAFASSAMPQLFALAREYADRSARDVVMFSSVMRAQLSLAWVIGPPLAFMLSVNYGFTFMYLCAAGAFLVGALIVGLFLPSIARVEHDEKKVISVTSTFKDKDIVLLFLSSVLMWTCNMMYLIDMPIYTVEELGLDPNLAGYLMGTAAGLEIPIMLVAGFYAQKLGKYRMMLFAIVAGVLFYAGLVLFPTKIGFVVAQLFNALFIGIIAGIGMLYFQDLMPGRPGEATTLFTNSILMGTILAGVFQGVLVEQSGHPSVYVVALLLMLISFFLSARVRKI